MMLCINFIANDPYVNIYTNDPYVKYLYLMIPIKNIYA